MGCFAANAVQTPTAEVGSICSFPSVSMYLNWPGDASSKVITTGDRPAGRLKSPRTSCFTVIGRYPRELSSSRSRANRCHERDHRPSLSPIRWYSSTGMRPSSLGSRTVTGAGTIADLTCACSDARGASALSAVNVSAKSATHRRSVSVDRVMIITTAYRWGYASCVPRTSDGIARWKKERIASRHTVADHGGSRQGDDCETGHFAATRMIQSEPACCPPPIVCDDTW